MPTITPIDEAGDCRVGSLDNITRDEITAILGFPPNVDDDPSKVANSWGFLIDGVRYGIWDYKGSSQEEKWSVYFPHGKYAALEELFGNRFHR